MNTIKDYIKKIVSLLTSYKDRATEEKIAIRPSNDWFLMIVVFFIAFIFICVFSFYMYINVKNETFWTVMTENQTQHRYKINKKNLDIVNDVFEQKQQKLSNIENNQQVVRDPSL